MPAADWWFTGPGDGVW